MKTPIALLAAACALSLSACGNNDAPPPDTPGTTAAPAAAPAPPPMDAPVAGTDAAAPDAMGDMPPATPDARAASGTSSANGKPDAVVDNCATTIEGNDAMQFNVGAIVVPSSCSEFTITLNHVGKLPVAAMGHNVVISGQADMQAVNADGIAAGAAAGFVKAGDARVVAASDMVGGGQSTSVTFPVARLKDGGPYMFFCSFPGHAALMKGAISVGG